MIGPQLLHHVCNVLASFNSSVVLDGGVLIPAAVSAAS